MSPLEISNWFDNEVLPHEGALRGYLYHRIKEPADIDDIIQESYRRILVVKREKAVQSPRGLLFTIAKNLERDLYRGKFTANTFPVAELEELDVYDNERETHELLCSNDELEILKGAIRSLPPRCRKVMILRKFENLSHRQIAEKMNISIHTVETQLTKGLKKCRQYFERQGLLPVERGASERAK